MLLSKSVYGQEKENGDNTFSVTVVGDGSLSF